MFDTFAYILHVLSMVIISSQMFPGGASLRTVFIIKFSGWIIQLGFGTFKLEIKFIMSTKLKTCFRDPTKYLADFNFRNQLNLDAVATTDDVWETLVEFSNLCLVPSAFPRTKLGEWIWNPFLEKTVINIIHGPSHYANGWQKKPEIMSEYANDLVNYRIGPARLTQFRHQDRASHKIHLLSF